MFTSGDAEVFVTPSGVMLTAFQGREHWDVVMGHVPAERTWFDDLPTPEDVAAAASRRRREDFYESAQTSHLAWLVEIALRDGEGACLWDAAKSVAFDGGRDPRDVDEAIEAWKEFYA